MPDIADNNTTTSSISVGGSVSSSIETLNDHDWFRIDLVAGQTITILLSGSGATPLSDPYLRLRDASGNLLVENDDSGGSLNSTINYTATTTGTFYIDAAAWASATGETTTGTYTLEVRPYTPPPIATVDQFANQLTNGYWGGSSHHFVVSPGGNLTVNLTALTADGINLARLALRQWSDVIGVTFVEVTSGGQITFDDNQEGAFSSASYSNGVTTSAIVNVSNQWLADYGTTINTYGYQTYIHEIGHALGLGHAGDYNSTAVYSSDARFLNDAWPMSVMSYFSVDENPFFSNQYYARSYLGTPMIADIAAMSVLYGLSTTTRAGATTYGFNSNAGDVYNASLYRTIAFTVFDSGGVDTLDYSGFSDDQNIDLREGYFSDVGGRIGVFSIALGTVIENAIGGPGSEHIYGNDVANMLSGGGRTDWLYGNGGDDTLNGGSGADGLVGGAGNDTFIGTLSELNGDTIVDFSVGDRIVFSDANLSSFTYSITGSTLNYSGGSLTFGNYVSGTFTAAANGGVQLTLVPTQAADVANDFNGDGRSDILWRNQSNGDVVNWLGQANGSFAGNSASYNNAGRNWSVAGTGDFNGDGRDDILWRDGTNGQIVNWLGQANGSFVGNAASFNNANLSWHIVGAGDFNGDGRDDILWRNDDGTITNWLGRADGSFAGNASALNSISMAWQVAGTGDFNGDGRDDILWRNEESGDIVNWLGQASGSFVGNSLSFANANSTWHVVGTGDFNGDGRDDVLWRNDDGTITNWLGRTNGSFAGNSSAQNDISSNWHVIGVGDYNGDGRDDILWRSDAGVITNWLGQTNGSFVGNANAHSDIGSAWHAQNSDLFWM